jgi:hypothetical protein
MTTPEILQRRVYAAVRCLAVSEAYKFRKTEAAENRCYKKQERAQVL